MTRRKKREFPEQALARESVWDYPRPPKVEPTTKRIRVQFAGEVVANTQRAIRILETSVYVLPILYPWFSKNIRRKYGDTQPDQFSEQEAAQLTEA